MPFGHRSPPVSTNGAGFKSTVRSRGDPRCAEGIRRSRGSLVQSGVAGVHFLDIGIHGAEPRADVGGAFGEGAFECSLDADGEVESGNRKSAIP
jgi:hypothetical protein